MLTRRLLCMSLAMMPLISTAASNTVSIIVPYPPGGPLDNVARLIGASLQKAWGKVIIENIAGGAGARGMLAGKNSDPDGKTLVMGAVATLAVNPLTIPNLPYQNSDFIPVALLSDVPNVLVMTPQTMSKFKITSVRDLLSFIKQKPNMLNCASGGAGSVGHIANALLESNGFRSVHIPYSGAAPAQLSLFSGETDFMFDNYASCQQAIKDGRLVALAVTTSQRSDILNCPTMTEVGIPMNLSTWFGLLAPKGTTLETCNALFNDIRSSINNPTVYKKLLLATPVVRLLGPKEFSEFVSQEQIKYQQLFKTLKLV